MGLFDRRAKEKEKDKEKPAQERADALSAYSGMRVELFDPEGQMLFVARLSIGASGAAQLQQLTVPAGETDTEPRTVRLRGYAEQQQKAIHMEGVIRWVEGDNWAAEDLRVISRENDRAFFRQGTDAEGQLLRLNRVNEGSRPCAVTNISAGGVCIRTEEELEPGERLVLTSRLLPNRPMAPLVCSVRRSGEKKRGLFEYGCRFEDLNEATEDEIVKTIMEMQRRQRKR